MIFEKQDYQQECITNIITLLQDFDTMKKNIDILMETGTGKTFTYLNLIFLDNAKVYFV